jgi:phospholipase C
MERAARLAGGAGVMESFVQSIGRAVAIEPATDSSYLDAEHVVILMQENRSFDHAFGTLRGVRGFNDPRAISLPDGNPVWVQANAAGERYTPFRFDMKASKVTWMGSLPHSWTDQVDARNHGRHDRWLPAKRSGSREYAALPLTLGYYTRADIPFYYALADAFTICDQYFCSSLTGTTANRCYLWTGTIRERPTADAPANVRNEEVDLDHPASWPTFPERLETLGISWKVYQNELTVETGLSEEKDGWLGNFSDNPLEFFRQYHVRLAANHRSFVERRIKEIPGEIAALKRLLAAPGGRADETTRREQRIADLSAALKRFEAERAEWAGKSFDKLSARDQALHARAFCTNVGDPSYRQLVDITYRDGDRQRRLRVPKGDVLHQFRADVDRGRLPTVSWLVSPEAFSDHPSSAWYGAWYIAEVLDILTRNPRLWQKTIFLLTYDENDGYFDHVPPFVALHPRRLETGRVTKGIDVSLEYVELEQDRKRNREAEARESPIGLGYRVPMVIASPWSRGGCVCSQVFDHTSVLQFLERLLSHKLGKNVEEPNISRWRRTVCGDLTSSFQSSAKGDVGMPEFPPRDAFLETIHRAQFKELPTGYHALSPEEIERIRRDPGASPLLPRQESGVRASCPLPYQLTAEGSLNSKRTHFTIRFEARKEVFGDRAVGSPFAVHALVSTNRITVRDYAVEAGEHLEDSWAITDFEGGRYHLRAYGPNGFFREFIGGADDPPVQIRCEYTRARSGGVALTGGIEIVAVNHDDRQRVAVEVRDNAYKNAVVSRVLAAGQCATLLIETEKSSGWYDVSVRLAGGGRFQKRYAGRVETGKWSTSDPVMGRVTG